MVTIFLPYPPSVNSIWRRGKGRTYLNPKYKAWQKEADAMFMKQRAEKTVGQPIKGGYEIHMAFSQDRRRKNADLDNLPKVVSDFMQRAGLIEDDCLCEALRATWAPVEGVFVRAFKFIPFSPPLCPMEVFPCVPSDGVD